VAVTDSLVPASTTVTTAESSLASVRTFNSVVAYFLSITLSFGDIVSETEILGLSATALLTGGRVLRRLSSCLRAVVSLDDDSTDADADAEAAGAGYATCGSSPGMTAPATPTPNAVITVAGTAIRAARTASDGRMALRGRGLDTCSASPEKMRPKRYLPQESKQSSHDCPTPKPALDTAIFLSGDEIKGPVLSRAGRLIGVTSIPPGPSITVGATNVRM
jgi:hypothetical protein